MQERPLSEFKEGERGKIKKITGDGILKKRLMEMGFTRGTELEVVKYAPLTDPIECVLKGYHVSIRRDEAQHVIMKK